MNYFPPRETFDYVIDTLERAGPRYAGRVPTTALQCQHYLLNSAKPFTILVILSLCNIDWRLFSCAKSAMECWIGKQLQPRTDIGAGGGGGGGSDSGTTSPILGIEHFQIFLQWRINSGAGTCDKKLVYM